MQQKSNKIILLGSIAALVSTIFTASYSTLSKILLTYFSTNSLAAVSQIFSVITLLIFFGALPELKKLKDLTWTELCALLTVAILSAVIQPYFLFKGLGLTSAMNGVLISRTQMVMVGIMSALWLRETITLEQIIGMVVMFAGAVFIATKGLTHGISLASGDTLLFISAFIGAFSTNVFKRYIHDVSPHLVVLMRNTVGAVLNLSLVPILLGYHNDFSAVFQKAPFITLAVFSIFAIIGAQFLWYKAIEMVPASRASTIGLTAPAFGIVFAMAILHEVPQQYHYIGAGLIVVGMVFATIHRQGHAKHGTQLAVRHWTG